MSGVWSAVRIVSRPRRWPSMAERARITRQGVTIETAVLWVGVVVLVILLVVLVVGR